MASHVKLTDYEYETVEAGIKTIHAAYARQIELILGQLRQLDGTTAGFKTSELSQNIGMFLQEIATIKDTITTTFEVSEEVIGSFQQVINDYDSLK